MMDVSFLIICVEIISGNLKKFHVDDNDVSTWDAVSIVTIRITHVEWYNVEFIFLISYMIHCICGLSDKRHFSLSTVY